MDTVGERLCALRKAVLFTQQELADRMGCRWRTDVAKLESGWLKCSLASTRRRLARAVGVPLDPLDRYLEGNLSLDDLLERRIVVDELEAP